MVLRFPLGYKRLRSVSPLIERARYLTIANTAGRPSDSAVPMGAPVFHGTGAPVRGAGKQESSMSGAGRAVRSATGQFSHLSISMCGTSVDGLPHRSHFWFRSVTLLASQAPQKVERQWRHTEPWAIALPFGTGRIGLASVLQTRPQSEQFVTLTVDDASPIFPRVFWRRLNQLILAFLSDGVFRRIAQGARGALVALFLWITPSDHDVEVVGNRVKARAFDRAGGAAISPQIPALTLGFSGDRARAVPDDRQKPLRGDGLPAPRVALEVLYIP